MRRIGALLIVAIGLFAPTALAQEDQRPTIPYDGHHIVCHVLQSLGYKPITTFKDASENPKDAVVIVLGAPRVIQEIENAVGGLGTFLQAGGNLMIATDQPYRNDKLRIRIRGNLVEVPEGFKVRYTYHDVRCPKLPVTEWQWIDPADPELGRFKPETAVAHDHPLFSLLSKGIATNLPSVVDVRPDAQDLNDLLSFPFFGHEASGAWRGGLPRYMVGAGKKSPPRGRVLYIAGHGMFVNGMMLQEDNDNFAFTINAFRWLREGPDKTTRSRALLVYNGEIITDFDMNLTPPPSIPMPPTKVIGKLIRGLEDERWFHKTVADAIGSRLGLVCAIIAGVATFVLLMYGAKKFFAGRHHLETKVPAL